MIIGDRIRSLREIKGLSQGDVEKRSGMLRCYISRVENGHTVPSLETMEKFARALEVPLHQFFYEGAEPPESLVMPSAGDVALRGERHSALGQLAEVFSKLTSQDQQFLIQAAQRLNKS
jgi:transcriptional regulator with XRE-family HTH domain